MRQMAWVPALLLMAGCAGGVQSVPTDTCASLKPEPAKLLPFLESELARLGVDVERKASAAPSGADNAVLDLAIDSATPSWPREYTFSLQVGDYDQNGLVNVSDLTPLGANFGAGVEYDAPAEHAGIGWWPAGDPEGGGYLNWRRARIDGNHDGLINVSDITPIAQHWQESCRGYRVYLAPPGGSPARLPNPQDAGAEVTLGRPAVEQGAPVRYHFSYAAGTAGEYQVYVVACGGADYAEGTPGNVLTFTVPPPGENLPPTVSLAADPAAGQAPLAVQFIAIAGDLDGVIELYEWDLDGDGLYEQATGPTPYIDFTYTSAGTYDAAVQVTDNDGATATASAVVEVSGSTANLPPVASFFASVLAGPVPLAVAFDAAGSTDPDGQIVLYEWDLDGDGAFELSGAATTGAQHTYAAAELCLAALRVTDDAGATDTFQTCISAGASWYVRESPALGGIHPGLADVGGRPAIAYVVPHSGYYSSGPLYFALADDGVGLSWPAPVQLAESALRCAVAEVEGRPAVAYLVKHSSTDYNLCYRRALDSAGNSWGDEMLIDTWAQDFFYLELVIVAGRPAVLYQGTETLLADQPPAVKYVRASDAFGAAWPEPVVTYVLGDEGLGSLDLEVVDNQPAMLLKMQKVSTMDPGHRGVFYRAANETGSNWESTPYEFNYMGTNALCVADGKPAVVHQFFGDLGEGTVFFLDYLRADDAGGTNWTDSGDITTNEVDVIPFCPRLVADDQRVYCGYLDWGANKYGQMAVVSLDPAGASWGEGEVLDPMRPDTYFGSVMALVGGRAMLAYGAVVGGECRVRLAVYAY